MNLQESIRRILREDKDHTNLLKGIIDSSDIFDYKHFCGFDIITPEERSDQYNFLNKNKIPYLIKVYFVGGPNSEVWPRTQAIRNKELDLMEELHEYIKSFVPFNIEMMGSHVNSCEGYDKLMKRKYSTDDLQESIKRILREKSDKVMNMQSKILSQFRKQDQMERNEYSKFVQSEFGGDYERGAKEYAKIKNRNSDDIFGDKKRIREFILINFDFNTFSSKDWENYWLLSQHSDNHPEFQKKALNIIKQNLGEDNEYYEYLHDRISCRESGTQIYGTQNICKKSKMNLQESIRRILREEIEFNYGQDLFDYHKKENLPYHSKYKRGESIDYYKKHFIDEVKKHIVEDNQILLYRVVATKKEKDIKKPFGTYWAFKKEDSQVVDWENIKDTDDLKLFRITALFNLSDINWKDSFDLYLMNDFMESEIRVKDGANPEEYFIEEL